jgi:hypothetical protein
VSAIEHHLPITTLLAGLIAMLSPAGCGGGNGGRDGGPDDAVADDPATEEGVREDVEVDDVAEGEDAVEAWDGVDGDDAGAVDPPPEDGAADVAEGEDAAFEEACVPESDAEICEAASAQCGALTRTDRCGVSRTVDCGTCEGFLACGGDNRCGCDAPPPISSVSCIADSIAVLFSAGGVERLWYVGRRSDVALPPCGSPTGYTLVSDADRARGRVNLPGGPFPGECWVARFCSEDTRCTESWSDPVDVRFCVTSDGAASCTVL